MKRVLGGSPCRSRGEYHAAGDGGEHEVIHDEVEVRSSSSFSNSSGLSSFAAGGVVGSCGGGGTSGGRGAEADEAESVENPLRDGGGGGRDGRCRHGGTRGGNVDTRRGVNVAVATFVVTVAVAVVVVVVAVQVEGRHQFPGDRPGCLGVMLQVEKKKELKPGGIFEAVIVKKSNYFFNYLKPRVFQATGQTSSACIIPPRRPPPWPRSAGARAAAARSRRRCAQGRILKGIHLKPI